MPPEAARAIGERPRTSAPLPVDRGAFVRGRSSIAGPGASAGPPTPYPSHPSDSMSSWNSMLK